MLIRLAVNPINEPNIALWYAGHCISPGIIEITAKMKTKMLMTNTTEPAMKLPVEPEEPAELPPPLDEEADGVFSLACHHTTHTHTHHCQKSEI